MKKYHLYFDETERRVIILCLNDFRNKLIADGRYTDCVDELIIKFAHAKTVKLKYGGRKTWQRQFLRNWAADMSGRGIT